METGAETSAWNLRNENNSDLGDMARLRAPLEWLARWLLLVGVLGFAAVSFRTTLSGFEMTPSRFVALGAALALQAMLLAAAVIYSLVPRLTRQRMYAGIVLSICLLLSVFFSYADLRHHLDADIANRQAPYVQRRAAAENNARLTKGAIEFKGAATGYLSGHKLAAEGAWERAHTRYTSLREEARQTFIGLRRDRKELDQASDPTRIAQFKMREQAAEERYRFIRNAEVRSAGEMEAQQSHLAQIEATARQIEQFNPNFFGVSAANKQTLLAHWISAWSSMSVSFQAEHPMPAFYRTAGAKVPQGKNEPILGALKSIRHPTSADGFALALASIFDLIPTLAILSTETRKRLGLETRLRALRRWMARVKREAQLSEGFVPWVIHVVRQVISGKAATHDDPEWRNFQAGTDARDLSMVGFNLERELEFASQRPVTEHMLFARTLRPVLAAFLFSHRAAKDLAKESVIFAETDGTELEYLKVVSLLKCQVAASKLCPEAKTLLDECLEQQRSNRYTKNEEEG